MATEIHRMKGYTQDEMWDILDYAVHKYNHLTGRNWGYMDFQVEQLQALLLTMNVDTMNTDGHISSLIFTVERQRAIRIKPKKIFCN